MGSQISSLAEMQNEVGFTIQGERHVVSVTPRITPTTSLNTYLRDVAKLRDTKYMCQEGGCGSCIVAATITHPTLRIKKTIAVNSCLVPILACHNWEIYTVHGIGNRQIGYHPIQKALTKFNGSQCGYCSGGMIMNMYALAESNEILTMHDIEDSFGGNLCRCTGYRPIMDAFKSLAIDADQELREKVSDIEDIKICSKTNKKCTGVCKIDVRPVHLQFQDQMSWYKVYSMQNILDLFNHIGDSSYRFVAGNTGQGVYKIINNPKYWIDIRDVEELITYKMGTNLDLGANMSISDTMAIMKKISEEETNFWYLQDVYNHLNLVANVPVRNMGTLAGNLSLKHDHHEFPSDVFLLFETVNARITIVKQDGTEEILTVADYINFDMYKCVMKTISFKPIKKETHLFKSYKIMPRAQNAHAYVNAGFLVEYENNYNVISSRIVYGGINPSFIHAKKSEKYLTDKNLFTNGTLQGVLEQLTNEIFPDYVPPDAKPEFRKDLARNLFYKFILATAPKNTINKKYASGGLLLERNILSGLQMYQTDESKYPLTEPVNKVEAILQSSGEAEYIDDIPPIDGELFGAFVLAETTPLSTITNIDISEAKKMPGYVNFIDYKDIPGENNFTSAFQLPTKEKIFCEDKVEYNGQPVGVVLAETLSQALDAADKVQITYASSIEKPEYYIKPILDNKETARITSTPGKNPTRKGTDTKHVIKGSISLKGQYHFTMETQRCICVPDEDDIYNIYASTQWMDLAQQAAAKALKLPQNKINVAVRRLGGAYGSKLMRASLISTACVIACHKVKKPIRLIVPLETNMKMLGKRHPTYVEYEAGVDNNGVIQYLTNNYYMACGTSGSNESLLQYFPIFMTNVYNGDTWKLQGGNVRTDMAGNAFTRGPYTSESNTIVENIMEHIAYITNKSPVDVRKANMNAKNVDVLDVFNDTLKWATYEERLKTVKQYNKDNRWMKKGLSISLMNYNIAISVRPFNTFVSIYAGDGTVAIAHGGIECGQGINTKVFIARIKEWINVVVRRLGGAYGVKIMRASLISTASAIACHKVKKPIRLIVPLETNMKMLGKRHPTYAEYEAGVDDNGVIQYLNSNYYQACGTSGSNEAMVQLFSTFMTNNYIGDTWKLQGGMVKTDMAGNAYARGPGASDSNTIVENIMDHIAYITNKSPVDVRKANIDVKSVDMLDVFNDALNWSNYEERLKTIKQYNKDNRWTKKGLSISLMNFDLLLYTPHYAMVSIYAGDGTVAIAHGGIECGQGINTKDNRWTKKGLSISLMNFNLLLYTPHHAMISIYAGDGTVAIAHGGIECGQGINTKVIQVCAYILDIPMNMIYVKPSNTLTSPNNEMSGGSITSEGVCYATMQACKEILSRMEPIRKKMNNPTWKQLVQECFNNGIDLCASAMFNNSSEKEYSIPGACISEVQVDMLTGEYVITRVDLVEDVGQSMSPSIDAGQIEGAFIMGLGNYTCENLIYDNDDGAILTKNTWTYKIPGVKDVPVVFKTKFRQNSSNPTGVLNSKATGEPALCLSIGVPFALRNALNSARKDSNPNDNQFVPIGKSQKSYILPD